ncbi:MAG: hypothetical protein LUQ59_02975 [Methanothrix sp.]|nr:hypothetical protein [Methanothrix sp.]
MKALEVVEETDPQGTVVGVLGVVNLPRGRIPPTLWHLMLAAIALILALALLHATAGAVELQIVSISGNSSGQGLHSLEFAGDLLNVSILQGNGSTWHINASAMEARP